MTSLLAVAGAHLSGQPLHPFLLELGAEYLCTTRTAPVYRMIALSGRPAGAEHPGSPAVAPRPGLIRSDADGAAIEVEVYRVPVAALGSLLVTVAPPLAIGTVSLADGRPVPGFICEGYAREGGQDITHLGGWRRYLTSLAS